MEESSDSNVENEDIYTSNFNSETTNTEDKNESNSFFMNKNEETSLNGSQHRAKAFILNVDSNDWEEMATGICSPEPSEDGEVFAIRLRAEEDNSVVLFTAYFHKNQEIGVQNDTVLTWTTLDGDEAALSFESSLGCEEFWKLICRFYGKSFEEWKEGRRESDKGDGEEMIDIDSNNGLDDDDDEEGEEDTDGFYNYFNSENSLPKVEIAFPERPELSTLTEIEEGLNQAFMIASLRRQITEILIQYRYIPSLLEIFKNCEEFGMIEDLGKLFRIFKLFFQLNGQELVKELMAEDNYLLVAGVMEYGFEPLKLGIFREFLQTGDRYKQVIPINNSDILQLIHQTFRLQYFKDVILARILDEESSASFIILIRLNHMAIINSIDNDPEVLEVIRNILQNVDISLRDQVDILKFFKELLTIAKTVSLRKNLQIHQSVVINDFMKFITRVLNAVKSDFSASSAAEEDDEGLLHESKLLAIGLFTNFIMHDPTQIRTYLIQNDLNFTPKNLLNTTIDMFTNPETCSSIRWQLVSALKILLDTFNPAFSGTTPNSLMGNPQLLNQALNQKSGEDFLNYFYPEYACRLLRPIIDFDKVAFTLGSSRDMNNNNNNDESSFFFNENLSEAQCEILFHLSELLCSFIGQHKYRIKYLILRNLILQNAMLLFKCREKHLQLTGLRIFRATLAVEDEFYFRFFIQHRSFSSLFSLYRASGGAECDNLVTSAILEIFEFIRVPRDSLKALVRHLGSVYRGDLETLEPAIVFRGILETEDRFDRESSVVSFASGSSQTLHSDVEMSPKMKASADDDDDEDYFSNVEESAELSEFSESSESELEKPDYEPYSSYPQVLAEDEDEDHFERLINKTSSTPSVSENLPGSPTKKPKTVNK